MTKSTINTVLFGSDVSSIVGQCQSNLDEIQNHSMNLNEGGLNSTAESFDFSKYETAFSGVVSRVFVSPFDQGVGLGSKSKTLSAPNCVQFLSSKIKENELATTANAAIVVFLSCASFQQLKEKTDDLNRFLNWPELWELSAKVDGVLTQADETNATFISSVANSSKGTKEKSVFDGHGKFGFLMLSHIEQNPLDELAELLNEKKQLAESHNQFISDLSQYLPTLQVDCEYMTGANVDDLSNQVAQLNFGGHEQSHCSSMAMLGNEQDLALLREAFNL